MPDINITEWLPAIITFVLIGLGFLGLSIGLKKAVNEIIELFTVISAAIADNKITKEELDAIVSEAKDIVNSFKK